MNIKIEDLSNLYPPSMFRIDIFYSINDDYDKIKKEINSWIWNNIISYDCLKYGQTYIFVDEDAVVAFKLMWEC